MFPDVNTIVGMSHSKYCRKSQTTLCHYWWSSQKRLIDVSRSEAFQQNCYQVDTDSDDE